MPLECNGDCNHDDGVTVDDLLTMVNIALGSAPVGDCSSADTSGDGQITVDEILAAVDNALNGCQMMSQTFTSAPTLHASAACVGKPDGVTCDAGMGSTHTLICVDSYERCVADVSTSPRFVADTPQAAS